jgi:hypothetical protein
VQLLNANKAHWMAKHASLQPEVAKLVLLRNNFHEEYKQKQQDNIIAGLSATAHERDRNDFDAKNLHLKVEAASARLENARNMVWWSEQHLRMLNRKLSVISVRFGDTLARAEWAAVEFAVLARIEFHMRERLSRLREAADMDLVTTWVSKYLGFVILQQTLLDR